MLNHSNSCKYDFRQCISTHTVSGAGANLDTVLAVGERVKAIMASVPGTSEIKASMEGGSPEVSIKVDRDKMAG